MNVLYTIALLVSCLLTNSTFAQIDLSLQYDQQISQRDGKVFNIIVDVPMSAFSFGAGIQYAHLDDYRFLPTIATIPDGTIGKGSGIGFHLNLKLFSSDLRKGLFGELGQAIQFINPIDHIDNGIFFDERDRTYSVMLPSLSIGYLMSSKAGFIASISLGYGIESFKDYEDENQVNGLFKMSLRIGKRFATKLIGNSK